MIKTVAAKAKKPWRLKAGIAASFLLGAVFSWSQIEFVYMLALKNGRYSATNFSFTEENWDHPKLKTLRFREKLDTVISPGKSELEKVVLLRSWVHEQWSGGNSMFYYPPWDTLEILDLYRLYQNKPFCAQYGIVFLQACLSLEIPARYVDLPSHFVVEVWLNELDRWVLMDPTADVYFERSGVPLNGQELCEAFCGEGKPGGVSRKGCL